MTSETAPLRLRTIFGVGTFADAKREAEQILKGTARRRGTIAYSELTSRLTALRLDPDSPILAQILDEISTEHDAAGDGMLSAVVVHKHDALPGAGFFALASRLGRDPSDALGFHVAELARVHEALSAP